MTLTVIETRADLQTAILRQLGMGEKKALHGELLAQRLGLTTDNEKRQMREEIVQMRHAGIRVIGSQKGYFLAQDDKEIKEAMETTLNYIKSLCYVKADYKRLLNQVNGQYRMRLG